MLSAFLSFLKLTSTIKKQYTLYSEGARDHMGALTWEHFPTL